MGHEVEVFAKEFQNKQDDYSSIMVKAIGDRMAEAFAEVVHHEVRRWWGYGEEEDLSYEDLIKEKYRGIRPAPGYPSCPDHTEKATLWRLLDAEKSTGVSLTENFAMNPPSSVSGYYFAHPQSRYFPLGPISREQVKDYAERRGETLEYMEKWLSPSLDYDPGA